MKSFAANTRTQSKSIEDFSVDTLADTLKAAFQKEDTSSHGTGPIKINRPFTHLAERSRRGSAGNPEPPREGSNGNRISRAVNHCKI